MRPAASGGGPALAMPATVEKAKSTRTEETAWAVWVVFLKEMLPQFEWLCRTGNAFWVIHIGTLDEDRR